MAKDRYAVQIGREFTNSSGKKVRQVFDVHTDYTKNPNEDRDIVSYVLVGDERGIVHSCSMTQFVRWINS